MASSELFGHPSLDITYDPYEDNTHILYYYDDRPALIPTSCMDGME